jgi:hypothetical protein
VMLARGSEKLKHIGGDSSMWGSAECRATAGVWGKGVWDGGGRGACGVER